jgi:hypothetical protein
MFAIFDFRIYSGKVCNITNFGCFVQLDGFRYVLGLLAIIVSFWYVVLRCDKYLLCPNQLLNELVDTISSVPVAYLFGQYKKCSNRRYLGGLTS